MIEICNLRNEKIKYAYDVKVDRSSILGNPFYMRNENERDLVCEKYKEWFYKMLKENDSTILHELNILIKKYKTYGKLRLFCWCYPKRCHAETIKEFLEDYIKNKKEIYCI